MNSRPQKQECKSVSFQNGLNLDAEKCIYSFHQSVRDAVHGYEIRKRIGGRATKLVGHFEICYPHHRKPEWFTTGRRRATELVGHFRICYTDHRIPEWFTYRTKGASITFELAQPLGDYFSFLLCVVISPSRPLNDDFFGIGYNCRLEDGSYFVCEDFLDYRDGTGDCVFNHVYMSLDGGEILRRIKEDREYWSTSYNCSPKITLEFFGYRSYCQIIQECGIYPLSTLNVKETIPSSKKKEVC